MDDNENIKITINKKPINPNQDSKNIYTHIQNVKINSQKAKQQRQKENKEISNLNKYIAPAVTSVLIYVACLMTAQIPIAQVIIFEIPALTILSLALSNLIQANHKRKAYCIYLILAILLFHVSSSYTFLLLVTVLSQMITETIIKIFTNKHEYNVKIKPRESSSKKETTINFIHRIKYHVLLSFILFVSFTIFAYFYPSVFQSLMVPAYQGMQEGAKNGTIQLATTPLFINNFSVAVRMFLTGICFSIPNAYLIIYNALLIGFTGSQLPLTYFLSFTLPHGILELSAIILAGGAGFKVTQALVTFLNGFKMNKEGTFDQYFVNAIKMILDGLVIMAIVLVLLIIAAYVEANLTIPIGKTILGM